MKVTLTRITGDPIMAIEEAASNCYNSKPSSNGKIMEHCIKSGHTSVTEFCNFTFHIEGVSRALLAQLTRHRHAGYAVRSQRYCSEDGFEYVIPKSVKDNPALCVEYIKLMDKINSFYLFAQKHDIPNEDARMVLPNACCTTLEFTVNLRSFMNICHERLCMRAQWEIRALVKEMVKLVVEQVPQLKPYLVPKCEKYGKDLAFCPEGSRNCCGRHTVLADIIENNYAYIELCDTMREKAEDYNDD